MRGVGVILGTLLVASAFLVVAAGGCSGPSASTEPPDALGTLRDTRAPDDVEADRSSKDARPPHRDAGADSAPAEAQAEAEAGPPPRHSLVWVWTHYAAALAEIAANPKSFTEVAPGFYDVNFVYDAGPAELTSATDSFDGLTSLAITSQVHKLGMKCTPIIFGGAANGGIDKGIHDIIRDLPAGAMASFITSMVSEAMTKGYDGYNIDWEVDNTKTDKAYGDDLETFLAAFRKALNAVGLTLSIDLTFSNVLESECSGGHGIAELSQVWKNVDLVILEDYASVFGGPPAKCPSKIMTPLSCTNDFASRVELSCVYVPIDNLCIGLQADATESTNAIATQAIGLLDRYGIRNVATWPGQNKDGPDASYVFLDPRNLSPADAGWPDLLAGFLAGK